MASTRREIASLARLAQIYYVNRRTKMQPLEMSLREAWPVECWSQTRLLLAVSGGADSTALLRSLVDLAERKELINVAHFNHQWRGQESDDDEQFVRALCSQLSLPVHFARADQRGVDTAQRTEQAARDARYNFFIETAYQVGARYIVTAHTASDRVETMLHNLCRGTGLPGVSVPTQFRTIADELVLARPLLRVTRDQVLDYLITISQNYREDSSNRNQAYKRNFIRHKLLPLIREQYGEHVDGHLLGFSEIADEATQALRTYAERWIDRWFVESRTTRCVSSTISSQAFCDEPWPVIQMALESVWKRNCWPLQAMTRSHWQQIRDLVNSNDSSATWRSRLSLPGNLMLSTKLGSIRIESAANTAARTKQ